MSLKKNLIRLGMVSATATMLGTVIIPVTSTFASETNNPGQSTATLNLPNNSNKNLNIGSRGSAVSGNSQNKDNSKDDQYIEFNKSSAQYVIDDNANKNLSNSEYGMVHVNSGRYYDYNFGELRINNSGNQ
jgi:hypothetical protein